MGMESVDISVEAGEMLLKALLRNGFSIVHECGGMLACATCCVVVHEGADTLSPPTEDERDMLDRTGVDEAKARLACQAVASGGDLSISLPAKTVPAKAVGRLRITVSERAARHLGDQLAKHPGAVAVRLAVEPAGCSGFGYRIDPAHAVGEEDTVFEQAGVRIAVDRLSLPYLQGATVDLVQEGLARRLRFENPNARQRCGCGESFSA